MATFTWHNGEVPKGLQITQVYGLVFTADGRMLLKVERKNSTSYSFAGGTPEDFDKDREATIRREFIEEVNTTLKKELHVVGYQEVDEENGKPRYAQLRMVGLIDKIGPKQPDPDNGETYDRLLTTPERAIELLNWRDTGEKQVKEAVRLAQKYFHLTKFSDKEEYV